MSPSATHHDARTRWSLIATVRDDPENSADALAALAREYWFPVYAYVRRQSHAAPAAFKLTSAFFSVLTSRLMREPPDAGMRFRLYLINQLQAFLALGGSSSAVAVAAPYSEEELEQRLAASAADTLRPQAAFDRDYAGELMARALSSLREEARGRIDLLEQLLPLLAEDPLPGQCEEIAKAAGVPALAISVALKRLRQRFRELIDEQLARTVGDERALPEERRALLSALSGRE
jgi:hypothetical protein